MAVPSTRAELKEFCLRKLGKPVIEINIDDDQMEDRIDEALAYYHDYHFDGTERTFLKHEVTADDKTNNYIPITDANIIGIVSIVDRNDKLKIFKYPYDTLLNFPAQSWHEDECPDWLKKIPIKKPGSTGKNV